MEFEKIIENYLKGYAKGDEAFAEKFANPKKNIKECCNYIKSEAQKLAKDRCACIEDEKVYYWARHYYEEEIVVASDNVRASVNISSTPKTSPSESKKPQKQDVKVEKKEAKSKDFEQLDLFSLLGEESGT